MISQLRMFGLIEGVSLLALVCVAMPLKYQFDMPQAVTLAGWLHGLLFMAYVVYAAQVCQKLRCTGATFNMLLITSMIPFGMLYSDRKLVAIKSD